MNLTEKLQFSIIEKFSQGWSKIDDIGKQLPGQIGVKRACQIVLRKTYSY